MTVREFVIEVLKNVNLDGELLGFGCRENGDPTIHVKSQEGQITIFQIRKDD